MISILLATYNGEKYIKRSIDSIIEQKFTDWKLLIGFNGTTDSSKEIVASYDDDRISVHDYAEDKGKAKTLNKLLEHVDTPWCAIQDDDDIWHRNKLKKQMEYIKGYDVIGTQIIYINEEEKFTGAPVLGLDNVTIRNKSLGGENQIANSSAIFKTELARKVNGWNEELDLKAEEGYQPCEDFDFWLKIMRLEGTKFYNTKEALCLHRVHANSNFNTKKYNIDKIL